MSREPNQARRIGPASKRAGVWLLQTGCLLFAFPLQATFSTAPVPEAQTAPRSSEGPTAPASGCYGSSFGQHQSNVTSQLSSVASGVIVTQLTDGGGNWISYHDIPAYSVPLHRIFYNQMKGNQKIMANADGSDAQVLSSEPDSRPTRTRELYLSFDGTLAYYLKSNPGSGVDLYAIHLKSAGPCKEVRLTNLDHEGGPVKVSTTTVDPKSGKNVIGYAESNVLHRVLEDGSRLPDVSLPDPENEFPFHILRFNPRFPNILFYRRNKPGERFGMDSLWVADLSSPGKAYDLAANYEKLAHPAWSEDGLQIGFRDRSGRWYVADAVRSDGTLNISHSSFPVKSIGPRDRGLDAQFCSWAPDSSQFLCITSRTGSDSKIFLMALDGSATKVLASTDLHAQSRETGRARSGRFMRGPGRGRPAEAGEGGSMQGDTWARFLGDSRHIIVHSNRTGRPEVYAISNFTPF